MSRDRHGDRIEQAELPSVFTHIDFVVAPGDIRGRKLYQVKVDAPGGDPYLVELGDVDRDDIFDLVDSGDSE